MQLEKETHILLIKFVLGQCKFTQSKLAFVEKEYVFMFASKPLIVAIAEGTLTATQLPNIEQLLMQTHPTSTVHEYIIIVFCILCIFVHKRDAITGGGQ